ncbi:MAG: phosphopantetheine-binding protein [Methylococcales bacterium]
MNAREIIARFITTEFLDESEVKTIPDDLNLVESGIVDSLGLLRIVAFLEEELNVVIEAEAMVPENLSSIGAILSLVKPGSAAGP